MKVSSGSPPPYLSSAGITFQITKEERSMSETSTLIGYGGRTIGREEVTLVPTPPATETHRPIPHHEIVEALVETLGFRHIGVVHDEYAVSPDGMKVFGVLDVATEMEGCRFSIGLRNSHDKSMRLAMTCGYRVFVCSNMAFAGDFTPVLAKHTKSFNLIDTLAVGVDRIQRSFEPMRRQVDDWRHAQIGPRSHPTCQQHWIASESAWLGNLQLPQPGFWGDNRVRTLRQQPNHSDLAHK